MLKIYFNESSIPEGCLVENMNSWYQDYYSESILDTDLAKEIMRGTSGVTDILGINSYKIKFGFHISSDKFSEGCKMLLMMLNKECLEDNLVFNILYSGENCEKFMEQIADLHDVSIYLGRVYSPFLRQDGIPKSGVMIMETGDVVYSHEDYFRITSKLVRDGVIPW